MPIKPRRTSIREAPAPGAKERQRVPAPTEPIDSTGRSIESRPLTFEELDHYRRAAGLKLAEFKTLLEEVYMGLDREEVSPEVRISDAKSALASFDRKLPKIGI